MLGSQLGVGAYRALVEEGLNGVMVSVSGQLQLHYVPFEELVDPSTLVTVVRYIEADSDFHRLTRFLETYVNEEELPVGRRVDVLQTRSDGGQLPGTIDRCGGQHAPDDEARRGSGTVAGVPPEWSPRRRSTLTIRSS